MPPRKKTEPDFPPLTCGVCTFWSCDKCWSLEHQYSHTEEDGTDVYLKRGAPANPLDPRCHLFQPRMHA